MPNTHLTISDRPRIVAACLFVTLTLAFLGTLTSAHGYDGVAYSGFALVALQGNLAPSFHANHVLHGPLAYLFALATGGAASDVAVHVRLQIMASLFGGLTIAMLYLFLRRLVSHGSALAASLAVAFTYAYWRSSTDVDVYGVAALLLVVAMRQALVACERPQLGQVALAGVAAGIAALGHIAHGIFGLVTGVVLLSCATRGRLRTGLVFGGCALLVLVVAFTPLVFGPLAVAPADGEMDFLLGYARPGELGKHVGAPWSRLETNLRAGFHAYFAEPPLGLWLAITLGGTAFLIFASRGWRGYDPLRRRAVALALGGCLVHLLFFMIWDPNSKYWIAGMLPAAVILALGLERLGGMIKPALRVAALAALPAVLLAWNLPQIVADTDPGRNGPLQIATAVREQTPNDAVILLSGVAGHVPLKVYIPYFGERRTLIVDFYLRGPDPIERLAEFEAIIADPSVTYFAFCELLDGKEAQDELERRHGLPSGAVARALQRERFLPDAQTASLRLYRLPFGEGALVR